MTTSIPGATVHPPVTALAMTPPSLATHLFDEAALARLRAAADVRAGVITSFTSPPPELDLSEVEVLVTGWGCPELTADVLRRMPALRAVVGTGGSAAPLAPDAVLPQGVRLTNAQLQNSRPVAEYALAMILLAGKETFTAAHRYATRRTHLDREEEFPRSGNFGRTVGIVGASTTGRLTVELLGAMDVDVLVYDPYLTEADARRLGVQQVGLMELMTRAGVVSVHAPELPQTRHMIGAAELAALADGSTLINTARGSVVDTTALVAEVQAGRISAILDVTDPEPLPPEHPLWGLPNVLLTPHIAGSMGNELHRLGNTAVAEVERVASGAPPLHPQALS